jgi:hypothetical protein
LRPCRRRRGEPGSIVDAYLAVARAHVDRGSVDAAARVIDPVMVAARTCGHRPALAQARLMQAHCAILRGDRAGAGEALTEVEALTATLGMPYLHACAVALRER